MDNHSPEQRRKNMQAVRSSGSDIEIKLRSALWSKGYRYRKNYKNILGKPDIVFPSKNLVIFCDGEFWHGYEWKNRKKEIKSNRKFWYNKIEANIERDRLVTKQLKSDGWNVLRFWGKDISNDLDGCLTKIDRILQS